MTPEEQRIALAEWAGWKYSPSANSSIKHEAIMAWYRPGNSPWHLEQLPDYLNDLNAVHELEKRLSISDREAYRSILSQNAIFYPETIGTCTDWCLIHASAEERCEALLKTLNLWKGGEV